MGFERHALADASVEHSLVVQRVRQARVQLPGLAEVPLAPLQHVRVERQRRRELLLPLRHQIQPLDAVRHLLRPQGVLGAWWVICQGSRRIAPWACGRGSSPRTYSLFLVEGL